MRSNRPKSVAPLEQGLSSVSAKQLVHDAKFRSSGATFSSKPILNLQATDAFELVRIGGHDRSADRVGVGSDEQRGRNSESVFRQFQFRNGAIR
jgi:hypothetical protein